MNQLDVAFVRQCLAEGMDDGQIADAYAEGSAAAAQDEAAFGAPDDQYSHGRSRWECDETYARNDAGEWLAFM